MKGTFNIDLAVAGTVFILVVTIFLTAVQRKHDQIINQKQSQNNQIVSSQLIDILFSSEGIPESWDQNISNLSQIGLLEDSRGCSISWNKLNNLTNIDYQDFKEKINTQNEVYFRLEQDGDIVYSYGNITIDGIFSTKTCILENEQVKIYLRVES
jgi:hypothetical protein